MGLVAKKKRCNLNRIFKKKFSQGYFWISFYSNYYSLQSFISLDTKLYILYIARIFRFDCK